MSRKKSVASAVVEDRGNDVVQDGTAPADERLPGLVIGLGASAGGLEALRQLLEALEPELPAALVVAQHMDPKHPSLLRELLGRSTRLPVEEVRAGGLPVPGTIYVTPPGYNITLEGGVFRLEAVSHIGPKPSVDQFFTSLADSAGENAVGVVLSGTGSDGALGIRAIKAAGGITFCQDEESAKYNGMPRAAMETGLVDMVLPPAQIASELMMLSRNPSARVSLATTNVKSTLEQLFQVLLEHTEADFSQYKLSTLQRRIQRRMTVRKVESLEEYLALLKTSAQEAELLFKDILISVTSFFRDGEAFAVLEKQLVGMVAAHGDDDPVRVWVPGCATGEEAYTIAILLDKVMRHAGRAMSYQVFASDIDVDALAHARRAVYLPNSVREVPQEVLEQYFLHKDDTYTVIKRVRERVVFARQDLVRSPPFSRLDVISCRNLLIYFNNALQQRIIPLFHYVLRPGGLLLLGKAESVGQFVDLFEAVDKRLRLYRKLTTVNSYPIEFVGSAFGRKSALSMKTAAVEEEDGQAGLERRLQMAVLEHLVPACVVVDERGDVLHLQGDLSLFLSLPKGRMDVGIGQLARDELKIDVRALLHKARREGFVSGPRVTLRDEARLWLVSVHVVPLPAQPNEARLYGVCFQAEPVDEQAEALPEGQEAAMGMRVKELAQELQATREHLQTTIEELETSNEELQSTNEELQSANEELQSANEELETANEELQSTNEELSTVNEELQIKSSELSLVNSDLEGVLTNLGRPLLVLDNRLRISRASRLAREMFGLRQSDLGQSIASFAATSHLPELRGPLLQVLDDARPRSLVLSMGGVSFRLTLSPNHSESGQVMGVVVLFEDLAVSAEGGGGASLPETVLRALPQAVVVSDEVGRIVLFNTGAERLFGYAEAEVLGHNVSMLMPSPLREQHDQFMQRYFRERTSHGMGRTRDVVAQHKTGVRMPVRVMLVEVPDGRTPMVMAVLQPVDQGEGEAGASQGG